ncbi:MAG: hypothetical protein ACKV19_19105 [Verrucomicrobiales bacterium]
MSLAELAPQLHALPRGEKIMALQLLTADLSAEEVDPLTPGGFYPVFTPESSPGAEEVLLNLLREDAPA